MLCIALGVLYAGVLYYRNSFIKDPSSRQRNLFRALAVVRFLSVTILAILLLSPFIKTRSTETQKPIIVFMQDNSESVKSTFAQGDSAKYVDGVNKLLDKLSEKYDVKEYAFSDKLKDSLDWSFDGKATNMSDNLGDIYNLYGNQNVGGIVVASDGIYNQGSNPLYTVGGNTKFPVFTVALGDTTPQRDLRIDKLYFNKIVYLNDRFTVNADLVSQNINSANTKLTIYDLADSKNPVKLAEKPINFTSDGQIINEQFILDAKKTGIQHYRLVLSPVEGEFTQANNHKDLFVEVLDSRQKILVLANSPHPDIVAIKAAAEQNKNYEVTIKYADEANNIDLAPYSLVVLHQLPSQKYPVKNVLDKLKTANTGTWFIVGGETSLPLLNAAQNTVQITAGNPSLNEVTATFNKDFSIYTVSDNLQNQVGNFPPMAVPFGQFKAAPTAKVMMKQRIGNVSTDYALMAFNQTTDGKSAITCGEGLWRWRLYDYKTNHNEEAFSELVTKTIQYLSLREDKRQFKVQLDKSVYMENEDVQFQAQLYNDNYELINTPDATVTITDEEGKDYPKQFNKTGNAYSLNAGSFKVGNYKYHASVPYNGKNLTFDGQLSVSPMELEATNTVADHHLLYQLSERTGGKLYYPNQLDKLTEQLLNDTQIKPVLYDTFRTQPFINLKWIFALIVLLLSLEWFVRKYQGGY